MLDEPLDGMMARFNWNKVLKSGLNVNVDKNCINYSSNKNIHVSSNLINCFHIQIEYNVCIIMNVIFPGYSFIINKIV